MHIELHGGACGPDELLQIETDCLVVGIWAGDVAQSAWAMAIDQVGGGVLKRLKDAADLPEKSGATLMLHQVQGLSARRLLLVGQGIKEACDARGFLKAARAAAKALVNSKSVEVLWTLAGDAPALCPKAVMLQLSVRAVHEACYRFDHYRQVDDSTVPTVRQVSLIMRTSASAEDERCVAEAVAVAKGVVLTCDLGNAPPNVCTPAYLAEAAFELGRQWPLAIEVLDSNELEQLGMQAFLAVARGSVEPPKLIVVRHEGGVAGQPPIVLVGKGVTFDAGGISIKPAAAMDEMKFDMCGAATVLGVMRACAEMALPLNVMGVIPACENMPSGNAVKPGDIVRSMSGKQIEVLNTDAEGRLILCDALTYVERFKPAAVIDVATLTGACVVALGHINSGLYANQDGLADELLSAAREALDPAWRMPLDEAYQERLDSNVADVANIGSGRDAGSVLGACFLSRFVDYQWAHLDIAGTAWTSGKSKGATGRPVAPADASF
jgi:Leucyl aminopeptidase